VLSVAFLEFDPPLVRVSLLERIADNRATRPRTSTAPPRAVVYGPRVRQYEQPACGGAYRRFVYSRILSHSLRAMALE